MLDLREAFSQLKASGGCPAWRDACRHISTGNGFHFLASPRWGGPALFSYPWRETGSAPAQTKTAGNELPFALAGCSERQDVSREVAKREHPAARQRGQSW